ncbi:MAG: endonuclease III [Bacteroidales bacterium]|nr:endonuclease III [Bacteroidales bacterium]
MTLKDKLKYLIHYFEVHNPEAASELDFKDPYQLLVAVVLSAQCTDKRVNMVTPALFDQYPTPFDLAQASTEDIFRLIKSVSYPNNKSLHLKGMAEGLVSHFGGKVPQTREELMTLPGVGRKSANVILSVCFNQPAMAVDTHVFRVAHHLGLVNEKATTPLEVEKQLVVHLPEEIIPLAHHWLILHGRYVCLARKPKCEQCGLKEICDYYQTKNQ